MFIRIATVVTGLLVLTWTANAADNSHAKVLHFFDGPNMPSDGSHVKGSSAKLTRGDGMVWLRVNTTELPPGTYTNWWIIFNNPAECFEGCDGNDLGNPAVMGSVFFATGGIVGENGVGHFRPAPLEEGDTSGGPGQHLFGPGLLSAQDAEIHYVIRYHGPAGAGDLLTEQISTINGGCSGDMGDIHPEHKIFDCYDPQGAVLPYP
jgi:hypothetical protein